jgi:hypothetical protein
VLRDEWGFKGFVVSDYTSEQELIAHGFAEDGRELFSHLISSEGTSTAPTGASSHPSESSPRKE